MERENLFRFNLEKEDTVIDREEFILRRESAAVAAERKRLNEALSKTVLKTAVGRVGLFSFFAILLLACGVYFGITALSHYVDTKVFSMASALLAGLFLVLSAVFWVLGRVFAKKNKKGDPIREVDEEFARLNEISRRELRVPSDARKVELFGYFYEEFNPSAPYDTDEVEVFAEDGKLCLHHVGAVIALPIDSIEAVVKVNERIIFSDWTKDLPHDSEEYAAYAITERKLGEYAAEYSMDGYYSVRFSREGEAFELAVPLYEIEPILDLLKMEVTEE